MNRPSISPTPHKGGRAVEAAWPDLFANLQDAYATVIDTQFELERRAAELQDSRDLLRQVIASMSEALFLLDRTGRIVQVNPAALELINETESDCLGTLFTTLCPSPNVPTSAWKVLNLSASGTVTGMEIELRTRSGINTPVSLSTAVVRNRNGRIDGILLVMQDLRQRQQRRESLVQTSQQTAFAHLARGVAEKLRNPLNLLLASLPQLHQASNQSDTRLTATWEQAMSAVRELAQSVAHIQEIGQMTPGVFRPLDIDRLLAGALLLYGAQEPQQPVIRSKSNSETTAIVQGDWHKLTQVLHSMFHLLQQANAPLQTEIMLHTDVLDKAVVIQAMAKRLSPDAKLPSINGETAVIVAHHRGKISVTAAAEWTVSLTLPGLVDPIREADGGTNK